jgi:hypothetical protein
MSRDRSYRPTAFWAGKANAGRRSDFGARLRAQPADAQSTRIGCGGCKLAKQTQRRKIE